MPRRADDYPDSPQLPSPFNSFRRVDPRTRLFIAALIFLACICFLVAYFKWHEQEKQQGPASASPEMLLGNPSGATADSSNGDNFLMLKPYFALSYNDTKGIPNWVSWRVTIDDLGSAPRKQEFDADTTLSFGFHPVTSSDYSRSGFDRGHMCPHSDRSANQEMSFSTFVTTNIIPQAPNVNRKAWEQLESYCRELVSREHDRLYIIAGPAGQGGTGSHGYATVLKGRVVVPAECWKIVVVLPDDGGDDLAKISTSTRVITVIMPNDQEKVGEEWAGFRTSAAQVERDTGFHFFDRVRADIADTLRQKVDNENIPPPRPHRHAE